MGFIGDTFGPGMGLIGDIFGGGGNDAANAAIAASNTEAQSQREALKYLKEINAVPQGFREESLKRLGGLYGLEGGIGSQDELIQRAINSPLYKDIMGGLNVGEDAIMRNAAATGGLRSGNTSYNLADYSTQLQNKALLDSYNQQLMGLSGLAGLSTDEQNIASLISGIGETLGQGQIGAAQAKQTASQNTWSNLLGLGGLGIGIAGMFCDRRLKKNIRILGKIRGFNWCQFKWNSVAEKLGLKGRSCGIMADEVYEKVPEAVILKDGFMFVLYDLIGMMPSGGTYSNA